MSKLLTISLCLPNVMMLFKCVKWWIFAYALNLFYCVSSNTSCIHIREISNTVQQITHIFQFWIHLIDLINFTFKVVQSWNFRSYRWDSTLQIWNLLSQIKSKSDIGKFSLCYTPILFDGIHILLNSLTQLLSWAIFCCNYRCKICCSKFHIYLFNNFMV